MHCHRKSVSNSAGSVIGINAYDEYGIPAATNIGRFQYTGQAWMPELGLYYYKARMYSATLGRFMQTDPIGYGDGINWYDYVGGDPINAADPSGLAYVRGSGGQDTVEWLVSFRRGIFYSSGTGSASVGPNLTVTAGCSVAFFNANNGLCTRSGGGGIAALTAGGGGGNVAPAPQSDIVVTAKRAWCIAVAMDLDIIPGMSAGQIDDQISDVADGLAVLSLPILTKEEVTGRRGIMRNAEGEMNPSGGMTSPLSVISRRLFGRNVGRAIGRGGSRVLPLAAVAIKAYTMYKGTKDAQQCLK